MALAAARAGQDQARIQLDYPADGSVFPPEMPSPTFIWRDMAQTRTAAAAWSIEISFADRSPTLHAVSKGGPPRIGPIDRNCIADTNEAPKLTAEEAASHTWTPDAALWEQIKRHSVGTTVTVTITGRGAISRGSVRIVTSRDPVGAPVFYRDVPLMPSESERGVIKPLAAGAVPLVAWRLRNIAEPASRTVMENLPVCANCHSFSADGKTMGMDLDGLQNNRGLYILTKVARQMKLTDRDVVQWRTAAGALKGSARVGFLSQVSPDGRYVATTIDPLQARGVWGGPSNYYVANFRDYRFLQVFYPTRGILSWYSAAIGILKPLPGADDARYVQAGGVWTPDGQALIFARAAAREPDAPGVPLAQFANDPRELPMRYDLYRIPFRGGEGGAAEPIAGASNDGASNSFPKVSPDGRWIVFVKAGNGLLMRPDSELWIVPALGGQARRMRCNMRLMNSWHSFSPNGRWMVFSSKARSPYTQMYLTHIDEDGNDSPAILIGNTTAANRAANLPEFVNIAPDALREIGGPALDYYRAVDSALYYQKRGRLTEAAGLWRTAADLKPDDPLARSSLGASLLLTGHREEAGPQLEKAAELKARAAVSDRPGDAAGYRALGRLLLERGEMEEAEARLRRATALDPGSPEGHCELALALLRTGNADASLAEAREASRVAPRSAEASYTLGLALERKGDTAGAMAEWRRALEIDPGYAEAHESLGAALLERGDAGEALAHLRQGTQSPEMLCRMAWLLATDPDPAIRDGREAIALATRALERSKEKSAALWDTLAAAYAECDRFADAVLTARRALAAARLSKQAELAAAIDARMQQYEAHRAYRSGSPTLSSPAR